MFLAIIPLFARHVRPGITADGEMMELTRRSLTLFMAGLGLVATLLVLYGGATSVGRAGNTGADVSLEVLSSPGTVSPGKVVTYVITATSLSTSNMSHFTITAPSAGSTTSFPLLYIKSSLPNSCTAPSSPATAPSPDGITCSLGALSAFATKSS